MGSRRARLWLILGLALVLLGMLGHTVGPCVARGGRTTDDGQSPSVVQPAGVEVERRGRSETVQARTGDGERGASQRHTGCTGRRRRSRGGRSGGVHARCAKGLGTPGAQRGACSGRGEAGEHGSYKGAGGHCGVQFVSSGQAASAGERASTTGRARDVQELDGGLSRDGGGGGGCWPEGLTCAAEGLFPFALRPAGASDRQAGMRT